MQKKQTNFNSNSNGKIQAKIEKKKVEILICYDLLRIDEYLIHPYPYWTNAVIITKIIPYNTSKVNAELVAVEFEFEAVESG